MNRLFFVASCIALTSCGVGNVPVASAAHNQMSAKLATDCGARDYLYLVGHPTIESRYINGDYRLTTTPDSEVASKRLTVVYDPNTQLITEVRCG